MVQPQAARTQRHLRARLFTRDVQRRHAAALQTVHGLQQQGRLPDAGVTPDQHHATGHDAAAQHPVELVDAGRRAGHIGRFDVGQRGHRLGRVQPACQGLHAVLACTGRFRARFFERVPGVAVRALAQPFGAGAAALLAGVDGFVFGHGLPRRIRMRRRPRLGPTGWRGSAAPAPGAAGGAAIKFFTGLTPGNTIAVTVGGGGYSTSVYGSAGVVVFEW